MASYTTNYGLHQWESTDDFLRTDFNTDFQKIDAALAGIQADTDGKVEMVTGTYQGDGSDERTITLGFQPKALYLCNQNGMAGYIEGYYYTYGGLVLPNHPIIDYRHDNAVAVEIISTGFRLYRSDYRLANEPNWTYFYLALR